MGDREVRDPTPRDIEAEAQACDEGRQADDVREGSEGCSEAREEDCEGFPREGPQGLHLRTLRGTQGMGLGCRPSSMAAWCKCSRRGPATGVGLLSGACGANCSSLYMKKKKKKKKKKVLALIPLLSRQALA